MDRPEIVTDEHLEYLDNLRESGMTYVYGARPYLVAVFGLDGKDAGTILHLLDV